jgi:hypothetical protein
MLDRVLTYLLGPFTKQMKTCRLVGQEDRYQATIIESAATTPIATSPI